MHLSLKGCHFVEGLNCGEGEDGAERSQEPVWLVVGKTGWFKRDGPMESYEARRGLD